MSFLSIAEVIDLIDREAPCWTQADNRVATLRQDFLAYLRDALGESGFPRKLSQRLELSLVPFFFQEANYDDIDWTSRDSPLGDLAGIFAIDVAVQTGGRRRHELTQDEYKEYVDVGFCAIESRTRKE